jgi:hypothetical protein
MPRYVAAYQVPHGTPAQRKVMNTQQARWVPSADAGGFAMNAPKTSTPSERWLSAQLGRKTEFDHPLRK